MQRWARVVVAYPRWVFGLVLIAVVGSGIWGLGVMNRLGMGGFIAPDTESVAVERFVADHLGRTDFDLAVLYTTEPGHSLDSLSGSVAASYQKLAPWLAMPIRSYWTSPEPIRSALRRADGGAALATISLSGTDDEKFARYQQIRQMLRVPGATVQFAGVIPVADEFNTESKTDLLRAEMISFPLLLVLLVVVFGGVVAAAVPLSIGGLALLGSFFMLRVVQSFTQVTGFAVNIASLTGLGLAIDYSLMIVSRFRQELRTGATPEAAVRTTLATAGRTVAATAVLVECALGAMLFFAIPTIRSLAYGGMAAVALASLLAVTALPALLLLLGPRINAWTWRRGVIDRAEVRAVRFWGAVAQWVVRRPAPIAAVAVAVLLLCALPLSGIRVGDLDHLSLPAGAEGRVTAERMYAEFPAAASSATVLVQPEHGDTLERTALLTVIGRLMKVEGVSRVQIRGSAEGFAVLDAYLTDHDRSLGAQQTVERLREIEEPDGVRVRLGGATALSADGLDLTLRWVPWALVYLAIVTLLLVLLSFGSIVLAVKAVLMSAASLAATFGVLTWIFVDGHLSGLLGVTPGPMFVVITLFVVVVVFGLSADYEVFLLARMIEAHNAGADTKDAIREGVANTGRIVTAAAVLLMVVTAAFGVSPLGMLRLAAVGVVIGLLIDVTVVRMLLVPALVALMGKANWWAPGPLGRILARGGHAQPNPIATSKTPSSQGV